MSETEVVPSEMDRATARDLLTRTSICGDVDCAGCVNDLAQVIANTRQKATPDLTDPKQARAMLETAILYVDESDIANAIDHAYQHEHPDKIRRIIDHLNSFM